ncbi:DUF885 domain-containing protein [Amycolatopsis jejuensis]|uniref:DUF885 domain-containing protein n=1 Tax=Amycolatopsis jejuensis TaxID=330084 RepID=UPI000525FC83|nr:DUF885 domain-containing protein [Amycolatopsis jejuensis]
MTTLDLLSATMLELWQERDPFRAAPFGHPAAARLLPTMNDASRERRRRAYDDVARQAADLAPEGLSEQDRLTRAVLIEQAAAARDVLALETECFTVSLAREFSTASVLRGMTKVKVVDLDAATAYLARLRALPEYADNDLALLRRGVGSGRAPLSRPLLVALSELDAYLATSLDADPLLAALSGPWREAGERIVTGVVRPAIERFVSGVRFDVLDAARPDGRAGVCWLPDGASAYQALLREETTVDLDPAVLHDEGLDLHSLAVEEIRALGKSVFGTADLAEVLDRLRNGPELSYRDGAEALSGTRAAMQAMEDGLPRWFGLPDLPACPVEPMPAATAGHYGAGQYMPGSVDGTRSGVFYVNTTGTRRRYETTGMIAGGAVPGSHIFWSYAFRADVPRFRRVAFVPAFVKGWAAYALGLAHEMGRFEDDLSRLGYAVRQAVNAARLVVDTGVHALGWHRDQALRFLLEGTALSERDASVELERIIAMPGEGPIFSVGGRRIADARAAAEDRMGDRFDIREFHDRLLENGALPLETMRSVIDDWASR